MKKLQLAILAVALAGASSASASVTLTLVDVGTVGAPYPGNYQTVTLVASGGINLSQSGVEAGVYNLTVNGVATPSFCIDIATEQIEGQAYPDYNYTTLASSPVSAAGPMGATAATDIEKLWAAYYSPSMSSVQAAELQVAIWEVEALNSGGNSGGAYTLTVSGNGTVTSGAATMVDSLTGANNTTLITATADLIGLTDSGQGYVVAVPETTTVIAGALLLLPLGASAVRILRRRRGV